MPFTATVALGLTAWGLDLTKGVLRKRRAKKTPDREDVPSYTFSGNSNAVEQGGPKPLLYGCVKASSYKLASTGAYNPKSAIYMISTGEVEGIPGGDNNKRALLCDDVRASELEGFSVDFRSGTVGQGPMPGFDQDIALSSDSIPENVFLSGGEQGVIVTSVDGAADYLKISIVMPYGIYESSKFASATNYKTNQTFQLKTKVGTGPLTTVGEWQINAHNEQCDSIGSNPYRKTVEIPAPDGTVDFQLWGRINYSHEGANGCRDEDDYDGEKKKIRALKFTTIQSFQYQDESASNAYPSTAYFKATMTANDENKGVVPTFGLICKGIKVPVPKKDTTDNTPLYIKPTYDVDGNLANPASLGSYDDWAEKEFVDSYCADPIWLVLYLLTNNLNGVGGRDVSAINIDLESFFKASSHNCETIEDITSSDAEPPDVNRYTFNYQIVSKSEIWAQCNDILISCRAELYWRGDTIYCYQDRKAADADKHQIDDSAFINVEYSGIALNDVFTECVSTFADSADLWRSKTISVSAPSSINSTDASNQVGVRQADAMFTGVTNLFQCRRLTQFLILESTCGINTRLYGLSVKGFPYCVLDVGFENSEVNIGDVIELTDLTVLDTVQSYRVRNINLISESTIRLTMTLYDESRYDLIETDNTGPIPPPIPENITDPSSVEAHYVPNEPGVVGTLFSVTCTWKAAQEEAEDGNSVDNPAVLYYIVSWVSTDTNSNIIGSNGPVEVDADNLSYTIPDRNIYAYDSDFTESYVFTVTAIYNTGVSNAINSNSVEIEFAETTLFKPVILDTRFQSPNVLVDYYDEDNFPETITKTIEEVYGYEFIVCIFNTTEFQMLDSENYIYQRYKFLSSNQKIASTDPKSLIYAYSTNIEDTIAETDSDRGVRDFTYFARTISVNGGSSLYERKDARNLLPKKPDTFVSVDDSGGLVTVKPKAADEFDSDAIWFRVVLSLDSMGDDVWSIWERSLSFVYSLDPDSVDATLTQKSQVYVEDVFGDDFDPNVDGVPDERIHTVLSVSLLTPVPIPDVDIEGYLFNDGLGNDNSISWQPIDDSGLWKELTDTEGYITAAEAEDDGTVATESGVSFYNASDTTGRPISIKPVDELMYLGDLINVNDPLTADDVDLYKRALLTPEDEADDRIIGFIDENDDTKEMALVPALYSGYMQYQTTVVYTVPIPDVGGTDKGKVLTVDDASNRPAWTGNSIDNLSNVDINGLQSGDILIFDGSDWVNIPFPPTPSNGQSITDDQISSTGAMSGSVCGLFDPQIFIETYVAYDTGFSTLVTVSANLKITISNQDAIDSQQPFLVISVDNNPVDKQYITTAGIYEIDLSAVLGGQPELEGNRKVVVGLSVSYVPDPTGCVYWLLSEPVVCTLDSVVPANGFQNGPTGLITFEDKPKDEKDD